MSGIARGAAILSLAMLVASCSSSPDAEVVEGQKPSVVTSTHTVTATPAKVAQATIQDANKFQSPHGHVFSYNTGSPGMCVFTDQDITCQTGDQAITASAAGLSSTTLEGTPWPDHVVPLRAHQKVFLGAVSCETSESALSCAAAGHSFTISGADRNLSTHGVPTRHDAAEEPTPEAAPSEVEPIAELVVAATPQPEPEPTSTYCGALVTGEKVMVHSGDISCGDAVRLMDYYNTVAFDHGIGARMLIEFDGWSCTQASRTEMTMTGNYRSCHRGDVHVALPAHN